MGALRDLTGMRFGKLTVVSRAANHPTSGRVMWNVVCDCGVEKQTQGDGMCSGKTISCGCAGKSRLGKDSRKYQNNEREVYKKEWQTWIGMKRRCSDTASDDYQDYMARGIRVADEWENDFLSFLEHIGPTPVDGRRWSVGRIDNNIGYKPGNVEWQVDSVQARNHTLQRNNKSGFVGVTLSRSGHKYGHDYYLAYWNELDGKRKSKCFCTFKYGDEEALRLAVEYREKQIQRLNTEGAGYACSHGAQKFVKPEETINE